MALCSLEEALAYENPHVVWKFLETYEVDQATAEALFTELKRWLWLRALAIEEYEQGVLDAPLEFVVTDALRIFDEMWHIFLLDTRANHDFCVDHLGHFIHHEPNIPERYRDQTLEAVDARRRTMQVRLERQIEYIYERLGGETVLLWYDTYLNEYSEARIASLHKYFNFDEAKKMALRERGSYLGFS